MAKHNWSDDESLVVLFARIFNTRFCPEQNVEEHMKTSVLPAYFFGWCAQMMPMMDASALCEEAEVEFHVWELAQQMANDPLGPERMFSVWPNIAYSSRPKPQHGLRRVTWNLFLEYEDGRIYPVQMHCSKEMLPGGQFHDSTVAFLMYKNFMKGFVQPFADSGIDGLHEEAKPYGEEAFNILMGTCLQVIPQLKPEHHARLKDWMRLIQATFQPVTPPEAMAALDESRRETKSSPLGGWD